MIHLPTPKERSLYFAEQVEQESIQKLTENLVAIIDDDKYLKKLYSLHDLEYKPKPVNIYIDSYGGAVYQVLGILSIIEKSKTPIHTYVTGAAMSAGFLLLMYGHKRFAYEHSTILCHQVHAGTWGPLKEMLDDVKETQRLNDLLNTLILKKTKIKQKQLDKIFKRKFDWFITAQEALDLKIIDEIL